MKSRPVSVNVTANGLAANQAQQAANQAQQTANQAVTSANKYKMAWDEANSETIAALDEAQKEYESNLAWVKSQIYEGQHQNDSAVASLRSDMESSWNSMSTVEESLYNSAITATSEVDSHLESLRVQNSLSLADLHSAANSLHDADTSLHADAESMRGSLADVASGLGKNIATIRDSLAAVDDSLHTTTSETASELANTRDSLVAVDSDMQGRITQTRSDLATVRDSLKTATSEVADNLNSVKNSLSAVDNDLSKTKTSLTSTGNSLATATSELQRQTGQLSGSLSTANSMIMFNSNAIAEVKRTAEEVSTTVSNIRVGGRNLLTNARTLSDVWNGTTEIADGFTVAKATQTYNGTYDPIQWGELSLKSNTDYVLTFYSKASKQTLIYSYLYNIGTDTVYADGSTPNTLTTDYQRYIVHFHTMALPAGRTVNCLPVRLTENGVTAWIYGVQLEEGNTATQWQPNPADTDQAISKVSQTADAIRADLTNTKGDIASVKATANSLQSQITDNKNNISSVKQTADSLTTTVGQMPTKWQQAINDKASAQVLTSNVDMNNLTTAGTYLIKDFSAKNSPIGAWFMATVEATADHTRVVQRVKKDSANVAYERSSCDSGWTAWERVATGTDVSSIKQTMDSITTRVSNAEGNVSSLQQTASGLQSSVTNAQGDISDLKQKADSITTTLSQGGSNLLPGTRDFSWRLAWWASSGTQNQSSQYNESEKVTERKYVMTPGQYQGVWWGGNNTVGQTYTLSFDARCDNGKAKIQQMGLEGNLIVNSPLTTDWTRYHVTVKVTDGNHNWVTYFSTTDADNVYARKYQIEYGETATPWNHSSGDISSLQQTAQGLTADMKDAKGNISSLQATAQGLTTRVSNTEGNVSSLQQTATKLQSDLTNAKGDISSLQQTANGLTSRVGNAEGNISQLQQTANGLTSTVSNMKSGGANMLPAGKLQSYYGSTVTYDAGSDTYTIVNPASANAQWGSGVCLPNAVIEIPWGQTACISMQVYSPTAGTIVIDINNGGDGLTASNDNDNRDKATFHNMNVSANTWTTVWFTYENSNESRNPKKVSLWDNRSGIGLKLNNVTWKIRHPMVQIGTFPSEWSPSPKDTDSAISQIKQTANQIQAQVDDNKGNIASVTQIANAVKTDLVNTKGDVAAVKAEADSLTSQMADANGNISQLQQTAKGLQSTVTDQSGKISQLQQDTDGLSATVGGAAIDLITNLDQQFVMGYGIANTTWQDNNSYIKLPTTKIHPEVLPQTAGFALNIPWQAGKTYMQSIIFETDATTNDSIQPQWTWFTGTHDARNATLSKLGNNTYRLIGSYTPTQEKANSGYLRVFDIFNFTDVVDVTTGTYLKFRNPRIWCPDDNSLAQLKLTADGLTSKVADAQGNVSNLQQTATKLQTQMTNTQKDVSSLKVTAGEISADLTNAKGDIARVKVTADSLTTSMTNAQDNISTLQHRADSITSTLSQGGVNLLTGTSGDLKSVTAGSWWIAYTDFFLTHVLDNKTCTARVWIDKPNMDCFLQVWTNRQPWNSNTIKANQSGYATVTFKITDTSYTDAHIAIGSGSGTVTFGYKELQIEYGETATPWKPSNGDIASLQQTAQGLTADMKDAKGNISSLQVTANQFSTSLHDAEHNVSSLQETAKELDTQIKAVDGRATTIKETADGISARVSRIEGNNVVGSLLKLDGNEAGLGTYVNNRLIAGINTNPDGVCITGKNLYLDSKVHIDDGIINASKITVHNSVGNADGSASDQNLAIAWGQLNSTIGGRDDQGNTLWGSINQTNGKLWSYYQELKNDGSSVRSLIQQKADDILLAVDQKVKYKTYSISASTPWDFNDTKSIYENWFINGDTSGNYFYNGPDGLKPWVYVQSRGSADGTRFVTTVWRDYDPTQYQRTWTGDHWTPWVMLPNSSNLVSAINLSPDGVTINGKNIELNGQTTIHGQLNLLPTDQRTVDQNVQGFHNPWSWRDANVFAGSGGLQLQSTIVSQSYSNDNTSIGGLRGGSSAAITTLAPTYLKFTVYPSWNDVANNFSNQLARTYIDAGRIETNDVQAGNFRLIGSKMYGLNGSLYVTNWHGGNFDQAGSVGFQVWGGIGLGEGTIYTPANNLYIQQGNVGPALGQSYSSAGKVDVHCNSVISQRANTVSSRLSVKTAITKVTYDRALMAVQNTDMYDYRYTTDETGQHYVSGIIDDIHDNPEYNMDPMLINKERTARIDANLVGYHHVVIQKLLERVAALEAQIK